MRSLLSLSAGAVLLGLVGLGSASAQTRPALVMDVDQPARHAYWEDLALRSPAGSCFGNSCTLQFATVPAGIRRVIEYVSCVSTPSSAAESIYLLELNTEPFGKSRARLPAAQSAASVSLFFTNQRLLAYYASGEKVAVIAYNTGPVAPSNLRCTLSGHDISVP